MTLRTDYNLSFDVKCVQLDGLPETVVIDIDNKEIDYKDLNLAYCNAYEDLLCKLKNPYNEGTNEFINKITALLTPDISPENPTPMVGDNLAKDLYDYFTDKFGNTNNNYVSLTDLEGCLENPILGGDNYAINCFLLPSSFGKHNPPFSR